MQYRVAEEGGVDGRGVDTGCRSLKGNCDRGWVLEKAIAGC